MADEQAVEEAAEPGKEVAPRRVHFGRPRVNLDMDVRRDIWKMYLDGADKFEIHEKYYYVSREAIELTIQVFAEELDPIREVERTTLVETTRRAKKELIEEFNIARQTAKELDEQLKSFLGDRRISELNKDDRAFYLELLRARQFQVGQIAKLNQEIRNSSDFISNLVGAKRRPQKPKTETAPEEKQVGDGSHEPVSHLTDEELEAQATGIEE